MVPVWGWADNFYVDNNFLHDVIALNPQMKFPITSDLVNSTLYKEENVAKTVTFRIYYLK